MGSLQDSQGGSDFESEDAWRGRSYQDRFSLTGERLLGKGFYDSVCYLVSSRDEPGPREPSSKRDWLHFSAAIQARISYLSNLGYP